jgi:DNA modification methylase
MKEVMELEENIRRTPLSYAEELAATRRLHTKYQERYGKSSGGGGRGRTEGWKVRDTAELLGISVGAASQDLQLAEAMERDPELAQQRSKIAARSMYQRKQALKARQLVAILSKSKQQEPDDSTAPDDKPTPYRDVILYNRDARDVIPLLEDERIACLITDPPWQVQFDSEFGSDPKTGLGLTADVLKLLRPKLQYGALCWMFCASKHLIKGTIWELIRDCGYTPFEQFLVWYKPHVAHSSHPYRELKNDYEPAVLFSRRSARDLNRPMFAVQEFKLEERKLHAAQKPWKLLAKLVEVSTTPDELVIDPFMGSGQTLIACRHTKRRGIGIELDKDSFQLAAGNLEYMKEDNNAPKS